MGLLSVLGGDGEGVEGGVDDGPLLLGDVRDCRVEGVAVAGAYEGHRLVVLESEELLHVGLGKVRLRVCGQLLEGELLEALQIIHVDEVAVDVELGEGVGGREVADIALLLVDWLHGVEDVRVPVLEAVHKAEAVREARGAVHEAAAVVHEAVRLGAGRRELLDGGELVHAGRIGEEARGAGDLRQLRVSPALVERDRRGIGGAEGV